MYGHRRSAGGLDGRRCVDGSIMSVLYAAAGDGRALSSGAVANGEGAEMRKKMAWQPRHFA